MVNLKVMMILVVKSGPMMMMMLMMILGCLNISSLHLSVISSVISFKWAIMDP